MKRLVVLGLMVVFASGCLSKPEAWLPDGGSDVSKDQTADLAERKIDGMGEVAVPDARIPDVDLDVGVDSGEVDTVDAAEGDFTTDAVCTPSCEGQECGDDGCGGSCGKCTSPLICAAGACHLDYCDFGLEEFGCCAGQVWFWCDGDAGLEWSDCAGNNPPMDTCGWKNNAYQCGGDGADPDGNLPLDCCKPECGNKDCGWDGCWGNCGACGQQSLCEEGLCVCQPDCADKECGDDGCGADCGACGQQSLCEEGQCVCQPDCADKECGDDGCGADCGACGQQSLCEEGLCVCQPDCADKECGDDGCGADCGACGQQSLCEEGLCVCQPDCADKECGDDGCAGSCGTCGQQSLCHGTESCVAGQCQPGVEVDCSGVPQCMLPDCNPASGECDLTADNGSNCSDDDACTVGDQCLDGDCNSGDTIICPDDTECATYECNSGTGECDQTDAADGTECENGFGQCESGLCVEKCGNGDCTEENQETCLTCPDDCGTCNVSAGFVGITAGDFWMGSPDGGACPLGYSGGGCLGDGSGNTLAEVGRQDDEDLTFVSLTRHFEMQITEVTQGDFKTAFAGWNPGTSSTGDANAVDTVSLFDALAYANWLSEEAGLLPCYEFAGDVECEDGATKPGDQYVECMNATQGGIVDAEVTLAGDVATVYDCQGYRLPSEAEWEYAARAGTGTAYSNDNDLDEDHMACEKPYHLTTVAWYCANNDPNGAKPVGQKGANAWGLKDVHGNVFEWVWDSYAAYSLGSQASPWGDPLGTGNYARVARGGAWSYNASHVRSAVRIFVTPNVASHTLGFRLARTLEACGDGVCQPQESCLTCEADCLQCPGPTDDCPDLAGYTTSWNGKNHCEYTRTEQTEDWHEWDVWIYIPPGDFWMGDEDTGAVPVHQVFFDYGFFIAKYEATVTQYEACVTAPDGDCTTATTSDYDGGGWGTNSSEDQQDDHPQNGLTWQQATDYCSWTSEGGRLPSESEWEYAATGPVHTTYPWGNTPEPLCTNNTAVFNDGNEKGCGTGGTWPVGSMEDGASWCGALDMSGNVFEWMQDWFHGTFEGCPTNGDPWMEEDLPYKVRRGGSFVTTVANMKTSKRHSASPEKHDAAHGVRCVRPLAADECTPQCDGKECGEDSCGGSCGECGVAQVCDEGSCVCGACCQEDSECATNEACTGTEPGVSGNVCQSLVYQWFAGFEGQNLNQPSNSFQYDWGFVPPVKVRYDEQTHSGLYSLKYDKFAGGDTGKFWFNTLLPEIPPGNVAVLSFYLQCTKSVAWTLDVVVDGQTLAATDQTICDGDWHRITADLSGVGSGVKTIEFQFTKSGASWGQIFMDDFGVLVDECVPISCGVTSVADNVCTVTSIDLDNCLIDFACYEQDQVKDGTECFTCKPFQEQEDWTSDGGLCDSNICDEEGVCFVF